MPPADLFQIIYRPRFLGFLFAAILLLVSTEPGHFDATRIAIIAVLLLYPHVLQMMLGSSIRSLRQVKISMLVDAPIVGALIALFDMDVSVAILLLTLLLTGLVIVGGGRLMLLSIPGVIAGALIANYMLPAGASATASMTVAWQVGSMVYIGLLAWIVYLETRRIGHQKSQIEKQRFTVEKLKDRLVPYISPQLIRREFSETPQELLPERKRLTVLFSDIEGFTRLMDSVDESLVANFLNDYCDAMNRIVQLHGGTLDKFIGDGLMVFFGDPESEGAVADAYACVAMGMEMRASFARLTARWRGLSPRRPVALRIGIHTGYCLVGSFGCGDRRDYTALGSTVNIASRLENAAGPNEILVSDETRRLLRPWILVRELGDLKLKGVSQPLRTCSVQGLACRGNGKYLKESLRVLN